jgi:CoA:oxalate CoA-transferase
MPPMMGSSIPASLVRNFQEVVEHPQAAVRAMFPEVEHPTAGRHRITGTPVKLSETPGAPGAPAPLLGQHTSETLKDLLGLDAASVEALAGRGIIYEAQSSIETA